MFNVKLLLHEQKGEKMKETFKMLQVKESTHKQAKEQAKKNKLSIRAYIQKLLDGDKQ